MKIRQRVIRSLCLLGLWLGLGLQAHAQTDTVTYVYTDPQGTPLMEADASGNVIARYDYTPYGDSVTSLGRAPNGPGYTGHVNDPETGLVYMQARYYQPDGRFLSPDPVGPAAGDIERFNRYAYASNDPIGNTDPTGNFSTNLSSDQKSCLAFNCSISGDGDTARANRATMAMSRANNALQAAGILGKSYDEINNLVTDWADIISPITVQMQVEIGSDIYGGGGHYFSSPAYSTGDKYTINAEQITKHIPAGEELVAEIHAHPDNVSFSNSGNWADSSYSPARGSGDTARYFNYRIDGYVVMPNGRIDGWSYKKMVKELNDDGNWHYLKDAIFRVR